MKAKRILCPVDFSATSELALDFAASLARENGAKLFIAHVELNPVPFGPGLVGTLPAPMVLDNHALSTVTPRGVDQFEHVLLLGDPAHEVCRYAEANSIDMIVVGSHGRTGMRRMLMGSVAEGIVRGSKVPVVTIKSPVALSVESTSSGQVEGTATAETS